MLLLAATAAFKAFKLMSEENNVDDPTAAQLACPKKDLLDYLFILFINGILYLFFELITVVHW